MHINIEAIIAIIIGVLCLKVFPGIVGKGGAAEIINTILKIIGIILIIVGVIRFAASLL